MLLSEMLTQLRYETRISSDIAHGSHLQNRYIALLQRVQEEVYAAYDWPGLQTVQSVALASGQRYAAYPSLFEFDGIKTVYQKDTSGDFQQLTYGIGLEQLNATDSDAGGKQENPTHWANYLSPLGEAINRNMFEVWPVPSRAVTIRFAGKRAIYPLQNPATDNSTIDGMVVVLHAAAEILAANKAEDAGLKLQKAQARMDLLKRGETNPDNRRVFLSSGRSNTDLPPGQRFKAF